MLGPVAKDPAGQLWRLVVEPEWDGDGFEALAYKAVNEQGEARHLPWSRFKQYDAFHFEAYVSAGFPLLKNSRSNWYPKDIEALCN